MRESRVYLAAVIAIGGFALYLGLQPHAGPARPRTFAPPPTPISTPDVTIAATPTPMPLDGGSWSLDFDASGIPATAEGCRVLCTVSSSVLHFEGGYINMATGNCDFPRGSYFATDPGRSGGIIDIAVAGVDEEPACYPQQAREIRFRLDLAYRYTLAGCPSSCVLRMNDSEGGSPLVYRAAGSDK